MIDIRIHFEGANDLLDENVYVDIKLPTVPQIGSLIFLQPSILREIELMWQKAPNKKDYLLNNKDKEVCWQEQTQIKYVWYTANNSQVQITLGYNTTDILPND